MYKRQAHTYVLDAMSMRAARLDRNSPRYRELKLSLIHISVPLLGAHADNVFFRGGPAKKKCILPRRTARY